MYNRYLASAATEAPPIHNSQPPQPDRQQAPRQQEPHREHIPPQTASVFADLTKSLSGRLQNIKLDMDTILVLVIVWFLLSDGDEVDWDQLLMIGALLLLGI